MSLAAALRIARNISRRALWHEDRCNWIGPGLRVHHTLGPDLYAGTAGIAWFLGHLEGYVDDEIVRRTAIGAIRQSLASVPRQPLTTRLSFYSGGIGVAFAAIDLARRLEVPDLERSAAASLREIAKIGGHGTSFDLLSGTAGAVAALPILTAWLSDESLIALAMKLADQILERGDRSPEGLSWSTAKSVRRNLTGHAHGTSGMAYALLELFAATGVDRYRQAAEDALAYERAWFDSDQQNWPDFRETRSPGTFQTSWCHGAPGIALSRIRAWEVVGDPRYQDEARAALRTTRAALIAALDSGDDDFTLCDGLAGHAAILLEGSALHDESALIRKAARAADASVLSPGTESPAFFTGLAGLGDLHLRLHAPALPSLLMLRPGPR